MAQTLGGIQLTDFDDAIWTDEFTWQSCDQGTNLTLQGKLFVTTSPKLAGRPITLTVEFVKHEILTQIVALKDQCAGQFVYDHGCGTTYTVKFRHDEGEAMEVTPCLARPCYAADTPECPSLFNITLKLMTI